MSRVHMFSDARTGERTAEVVDTPPARKVIRKGDVIGGLVVIGRHGGYDDDGDKLNRTTEAWLVKDGREIRVVSTRLLREAQALEDRAPGRVTDRMAGLVEPATKKPNVHAAPASTR